MKCLKTYLISTFFQLMQDIKLKDKISHQNFTYAYS